MINNQEGFIMYADVFSQDDCSYDEVAQYDAMLQHDIEAYENEKDEIKATDFWLQSLEPDNEEINEVYLASLKGGI